MSRGVLYISYEGMLEPLGQSQVLAYLEHLSKDRSIHLVSFEKARDWLGGVGRAGLVQRMHAAGIGWHPLRYHKRPSALATAWDILAGAAAGAWLVRRHGLRIVHARSYVAGVMALAIKGLTGAKFVFDMRGFWADERVDGGLWPRGGRLYRLAKWFERQLLLRADHVVSLTHAAVREMRAFGYLQGRMPAMTVIPTCADLSRFRPLPGPRGEVLVLGYVGSAGTWHQFDAVAACVRLLLNIQPRLRFVVINRGEHDHIRSRLAEARVPDDVVEIRAVSHSDIPLEMARMDMGIFFYKPSYSRAACAPTKLAEFLGCGIPVLTNGGVGDTAQMLGCEKVGVTVDAFTVEALRDGLERLLKLREEHDVAARCMAAARKHFSLEAGVRGYAGIYAALGKH